MVVAGEGGNGGDGWLVGWLASFRLVDYRVALVELVEEHPLVRL